MKILIRVGGLLGLLTLGLFVQRVGGARILDLFRQIGWPLLLLVPYRALPLYLDSCGWRLLFQQTVPPRWLLFWMAALRESINRLLPVASVGGEIAAIRVLSNFGYSFSATAASMIVEIALTTLSLCVYAALGLLVLLQLKLAPPALKSLIYAGVIVGALLAVGLVLLLRYGAVFERLARAVERTLSRRHPDLAQAIATIDPLVVQSLGRPLRLARVMGWQLLGLLAGALETWFLLDWLGHPVPFGVALALDSVAWALREFIFLVPAGLGIQEAALTGLGQALGIGADIALTLSLAKRLRELLVGAPVLLSFQRLYRQVRVLPV